MGVFKEDIEVSGVLEELYMRLFRFFFFRDKVGYVDEVSEEGDDIFNI